MAKERLFREWTPEELASEAKDSDERLVEATTDHRRPLISDRAKGGAQHSAGEQEYDEEERADYQGPPPEDPPRRFSSDQGA